MDRVLVRGCSGSGKSTFAAELARRLGVPHVELDGLYHQAGWQPRDDEEFRAAVEAATAGPGWVVDGNYRQALPALRDRVATVVWLDLPRALVFGRMVRRTLSRMLRREELWNGNRESLRNLVSTDPQRNIVLWTWTQWPRYHREAAATAADPDWAHAECVRLTTPAAVADFLQDVPSAPDPP